MNAREFQATIAIPLAQLEAAKKMLLHLFELAAHPRMLTEAERGQAYLELQSVRMNLPVIDIELRNACELLSGRVNPFHIVLIDREEKS